MILVNAFFNLYSPHFNQICSDVELDSMDQSHCAKTDYTPAAAKVKERYSLTKQFMEKECLSQEKVMLVLINVITNFKFWWLQKRLQK